MKNYAEMTDFEINWRVFETLFGGSPDFKEGKEGAMVLISEEYDVQMGEHVIIEAVRGEFNPCNSWADAGSIIEANRIAMIPETDGTWFALGHPQIKNNWRVESTGAFHNDTTPLRAAMIVFLMMQESK